MKRRSLVPGAMLFAAIGIMPQKTGGCVKTHFLKILTCNLKFEHPKETKERAVSLLSIQSLIRPF